MKRVLIIGVGSIGERHLRCFLATNRVQASICEPNDTLRQAVADRYDCQASYVDLDQALHNQTFDAAVVCTPAPLHVPMGLKLAEQGVHLLIEKPLSTRLDGVAELQQTVTRNKLSAGVAYVSLHNPVMRAARQWLSQQRFGRPVQYLSVSGQHFPTHRPAYRDIYYKDRRTGGGAIQDALTHGLNLGEWLVGPIRRLICDCDHQVLQGVEVEDTVHVLTRQGADPAQPSVMGSYALNQHQAPNEKRLLVICEAGTLRVRTHDNTLSWCDQPEAPWQTRSFPLLERDALFIAQANDFLDAINAGCHPACDLAAGLQTLKVNLAALASAEQQAWQCIEPA